MGRGGRVLVGRTVVHAGSGRPHPAPATPQDMSHAAFVKIIEFLYTDSVGDLSPELAVPLLIAAEQYLLERLKCLCEDVIRKSISTENVVNLFMAAHRYRAAGLKEVRPGAGGAARSGRPSGLTAARRRCV